MYLTGLTAARIVEPVGQQADLLTRPRAEPAAVARADLRQVGAVGQALQQLGLDRLAQPPQDVTAAAADAPEVVKTEEVPVPQQQVARRQAFQQRRRQDRLAGRAGVEFVVEGGVGGGFQQGDDAHAGVAGAAVLVGVAAEEGGIGGRVGHGQGKAVQGEQAQALVESVGHGLGVGQGTQGVLSDEAQRFGAQTLTGGGEGGAAGESGGGLVGRQESARDVAVTGGGKESEGEDEEEGEGVSDDGAGAWAPAQSSNDLLHGGQVQDTLKGI